MIVKNSWQFAGCLDDLDDTEFVMSASTEGLVPGVAGGLSTPEQDVHGPITNCHELA